MPNGRGRTFGPPAARMERPVKRWTHGRYWTPVRRIFPFLALYQAVGCLPDNSIRQVFGENVVFTAAIVIQTVTSLIFNTLFGVA